MKKRVFVCGHLGMVGSAICRILESRSDIEIITASRAELNLKDQLLVSEFLKKHDVDEVYLAAAKVGGIHANNTFPAEFIYENIAIQLSVIHAAYLANVKKLLFLGSSCIYPKYSNQPIREEYLLSGHLEPTNEPYALAKIAGIKLCESYNRQYGCDFRSVMPTNLFGPNDNFHLENSHVIPALIQRFHDARVNCEPSVTVWGSGRPKREFLYVDDMAKACVYILELPSETYSKHTCPMMSHVNIGTGIDHSISEVAHLVKNVVGFEGDIIFDTSKPDGTPRKLLDVTKANSMGWRHEYDFQHGLSMTYSWYLDNLSSIRI